MVEASRVEVAGDVFAGVVGQPEVVAQLRAAARAPVHAYLLVGQPGAGATAAAAAFAAALLCPDGGEGTCRDCRLVLAGAHPDVAWFEPAGASLLVSDAEEITRLALRSPVEGRRKVLVLTELQRVKEVGPALLKTIEEPPASTVFVLLADAVPPELVTIASRSVRIDVPPLPLEVVATTLEAEGADPDRAAEVALAAAGSLDRARLLLSDPDLAARREAWALVPARLDGTGAAVAVVVAELLGLVDAAAEPLRARQAEATEEGDGPGTAGGRRGGAPAGGRRAAEAAGKRELRRHRSAELRMGFATLAVRYRDALTADGRGADGAALVAAIGAIGSAAEALIRNPNEALLLQALFLRLPHLAPRERLVPSGGPPG